MIMATLSNIGLNVIGNGILHPKLANRFEVLFSGRGNDILTRQAVSTSHSGDYFIINFEDDLTNKLINRLKELVGQRLDFQIRSLSPNEEQLALWVYETELVTFTPMFDYAEGASHKIAARFKINAWNVEV